MKQMLIFITLTIVLSPAISFSADTQAAKTLNRVFDPVVVTGKTCGLAGRPLTAYGLYALKCDKLCPIPFQIDERDKDGKFALTSGTQATSDNDCTFDDNDELVFMAMDTGEKLSGKTLLPTGSTACEELEVTDPVTQEQAWVYLVTSNRSQSRSSLDYVSYDAYWDSFATRNYSGRYDERHPVGARYAFEKGVGGDGGFFIDRIKVRLIMGALWVTLHRSEEDILVGTLGYIDGPVRVIVNTENATPLAMQIPASTTTQYIYYYDSYADFAFAASFPLKPKCFRATIIDDFIDAKGWTFYSSINPEGYVIDGKMDNKDKNLNGSPWTWSALTNGKQCFWAIWKAPAGCPVEASLYFNDDETAQDGMEEVKGELPGIGFDFNSGWDLLKTDRVEFRLIHFYTRGYQKGMENDICNVHDAPLRVSASLL